MHQPLDIVIETMIRDAVDYPLPMRIAAWAIRHQYSEEDFANYAKRMRDCFPDPIMNDVRTHIRDFERGLRRESPRMAMLVDKL